MHTRAYNPEKVIFDNVTCSVFFLSFWNTFMVISIFEYLYFKFPN